MPKFYVSSGNMKRIEIAETALEAAMIVLLKEVEIRDDLELGTIVESNQLGWNYQGPCAHCELYDEEEICDKDLTKDCPYVHEHEDVMYIMTADLLEMTKLQDKFAKEPDETDSSELDI